MLDFLMNFVKILKLGAVFLLIGCGFHLAQNDILIGDAETLRLEKISNRSDRPYIDFLLEKELKKKFYKSSFYREQTAELELFITIQSANFSSQSKALYQSDFYRHRLQVTAEVFLNDLRNLQPAKISKKFTAQRTLELRESVLDDAKMQELQALAMEDLARKIFSFITE
jgi:outer membrane lipopolysaccharide assembly protein LptE/RlpB